MCFEKPTVDTSVQDQLLEDSRKARAEEEARKKRIEDGTQRIDAIFNGGTYTPVDQAATDAARDELTTKARTDWEALNKAWQDAQRPAPGGEGREGREKARENRLGSSAPGASTAVNPGSWDDYLAKALEGFTPVQGETQTYTGFDSSFYDGFKQAQMDLYQPELDDQFGKASDQLIYALTRAGTGRSTIANTKKADLTKAYGNQQALIASDATAAAENLRSRVQNEKSSLVSLLNSTGDADRAANEALSRSQVLLQQQPSYNPLGDIFAGTAAGIGNYYGGLQNRQVLDTYYGQPPRARPGGSAITIRG